MSSPSLTHGVPWAQRSSSPRWGRPFAYLEDQQVPAGVYIDGFNLYYRALKNTAHKWLNIAALADAVMPSSTQVDAVHYYAARVSGRTDPTAPARQHAYLRAIATLPRVDMTFGNFLVSKKWSGLVQPPTFRPVYQPPQGTALDVVFVYKTEEKGSDVNLGVHLVRDAALGRFDMAGVLTNDTDLCEPIRIVTQEFGLPVILLSPTSKPATSLVQVASSVRHIAPYLGPCQMPNPVIDAVGRQVFKPAGW